MDTCKDICIRTIIRVLIGLKNDSTQKRNKGFITFNY